ncbi:MAG: hypothetical protein E5Y70_02205 [Mesorhizobium sp.]|nr:MAG: hypothetical protein E5Y70_02205 [Mesorhizobium sp.]
MANRKRLGLAEPSFHFVIPGRSEERSDAAQTLGSMPLPKPKNAADQNRTPTTPFREKARTILPLARPALQLACSKPPALERRTVAGRQRPSTGLRTKSSVQGN